jgi:hypothetical protein
MLSLEGKVMSVITRDARTDKAGTVHAGYSQVQLMVEELLENDQTRYGIHTMSTEQPQLFEPLTGAMIRVPVRAWVKGTVVQLSMPPRAKPEVLS